MAIGNPINLTSNVEGKNISVIATAGQTQFTVTGGYRINQISVFRNGVRLVDGRDFTALDGSIVTLLSAATVADVIEFQVFDDFRVSDALNVNIGGTVNGNVTVTGILSTTSLSVGSSISLDATTGIITAVQVIGGTITGTATTAINAQGLTGTPDITVNNIVAAAGTFSGVLTYEDVTNIDSLGIVTARTGVDITANGLVVNAGVSTFGADLSIADKIIHSGDTNTAIRFPSNDTFTVETSGVQRLEVDSTGDLGLVGIATATGLVVVAGSGGYAGHTGIITAVTFDGALSGAASQVTVADESSDTTCFPLFATAATGNLPPKSGTNLTFNSSSGALTATSFAGNISGGTVGGSEATFTSFVRSTRFTVNGALSTNVNGTDYAFAAFDGSSNLYASIDQAGAAFFASDLTIVDKIIHSGDTNTAIRFPAADTFTVETAGSEALRVDSSARLLIGSTSNAGSSSVLQVREDGSGKNFEIFRSYDSANTPARIRFSNSRGTAASPTIVADDDDLAEIRFLGYDGTNYDTPAAAIFASVDGTPGENDMPGRLTFSTTADGASSPTERLRIDSAGNLGVGNDGSFPIYTGTNDRTLILGTGSEDSAIQIHSGTSNYGGLYFGDATSGSSRYRGYIEFKHGTSDDFLRFGTATTERLRIDSSGNLIIGSTSAATNSQITLRSASPHLSLYGTPGSNTSQLNLGDTDDHDIGNISYNHSDNSMRFTANASERLRIDSSGRLLINTDDSRIVEDSAGNGPQGFIQIEAADSSAIMSIISAGTNDANRCGTINLGRHRNSTVGGTPTVVQNGDALGSIVFSGGDGTDMRTRGATIIASCDGSPGSNDMPTRLTFSTGADGGGGATTERLRIDSRGSFQFSNGLMCESVKINSTARTGTQAVNLDDGMVHYFSSSSTGTWKPNFTMSAGNDINATISVGDVVSPTMIVNKSNTAHYADSVQVDGSDRTIDWLGGAPTDGGGNNTFDVYSYTIIKTGSDTFVVFGSVSNYE